MCFSVYMLGHAHFHGCPSPASSTQNSEEEGIPLSQEVDLNSILGRMAGNTLMHTEDNVVSYFKAIIEEGKKR